MRWLLALPLILASVPAEAASFGLDSYVDFRLIAPGDERSWLDGGLGKLRYGKGDSNFQFAEAVADGHVLFTPELLAVAAVRVEPHQRNALDVTEAYLRYRPVSTTRWRWAVKGGAFFAPFSLENTETGWASYWTLTPSAINSWFGDELRTIGSEGRVEWRGDDGTATLTGAVFGWNDPAGVMIADRGWSFDDRPTGLFDRLREPDATLRLFGDTPPDDTPIFAEFDGRAGWYAGLSWDDARMWHAEIDYYDNGANASAHDDDYYAWRTWFWNGGISAHLGDFALIAQGLTGRTVITPSPAFSAVTDFNSAFLLLGWEKGDWRLAVRGDVFGTAANTTFGPSPLDEEGKAVDFSVSWLPKDWVRVTGEVLSVDSTRAERVLDAIAPRQTETLFQLSAKLYFSR